jgi:hypothetical protein
MLAAEMLLALKAQESAIWQNHGCCARTLSTTSATGKAMMNLLSLNTLANTMMLLRLLLLLLLLLLPERKAHPYEKPLKDKKFGTDGDAAYKLSFNA